MAIAIVGVIIVLLVVVLSARRSQKRAAEIKSTILSMSKDLPLGGATSQALQEQINAAVAQAMSQGVAAAASTVTRSQMPAPGTLGIGEITSISSLATGSPEATLELDAIGAPKRRVVAPLSEGHGLTRGDRIYVLLDQNDPSVVTLAPASMTGGQVLPTGSNRLDVLVLGPQILERGAKAKGLVKAAESMPLANAALTARGFSKWRLDLEVTPESGWPYRAELTISLSTPEKAARIAHAGAEVMLRYDPDDTKTVTIDSVAMGYGNPYEAALSSVSSTQTVTVTTTTSAFGGNTLLLVNSGRNLIEVIKAIREVRPGTSLADAKNLAESAPQKLLENLTPEQADAIKRQLEHVGATVVIQ